MLRLLFTISTNNGMGSALLATITTVNLRFDMVHPQEYLQLDLVSLIIYPVHMVHLLLHMESKGCIPAYLLQRLLDMESQEEQLQACLLHFLPHAGSRQIWLQVGLLHRLPEWLEHLLVCLTHLPTDMVYLQGLLRAAWVHAIHIPLFTTPLLPLVGLVLVRHATFQPTHPPAVLAMQTVVPSDQAVVHLWLQGEL